MIEFKHVAEYFDYWVVLKGGLNVGEIQNSVPGYRFRTEAEADEFTASDLRAIADKLDDLNDQPKESE